MYDSAIAWLHSHETKSEFLAIVTYVIYTVKKFTNWFERIFTPRV